ncbi:MAG: hypothetical protein M1281_03295 [Chloroflexi bacterium]|nr:hypothetical protein [Chloroflexota bacterium]
MKHFVAIIAALAITGVVAGAMFAIGGNALLNTNTLPIFNNPKQALATATQSANPSSTSSANQAQLQAEVQQLQGLISQYQTREQQYQTQLNNAAQQLQQAQAQIQQYQSILVALQNAGIIRIGQDGRIYVPQGNFQ